MVLSFAVAMVTLLPGSVVPLCRAAQEADLTKPSVTYCIIYVADITSSVQTEAAVLVVSLTFCSLLVTFSFPDIPLSWLRSTCLLLSFTIAALTTVE
jgi:hypothetical protein